MDVGRIWGSICLAWRVHHLGRGVFNIPQSLVTLRNRTSILSQSKSCVASQIHLIRITGKQTHGILHLGFITQLPRPAKDSVAHQITKIHRAIIPPLYHCISSQPYAPVYF